MDLNEVHERRKQGEKWKTLAEQAGMPATTLRGRLYRAGLLVKSSGRKSPRRKAVVTKSPATAPAAAAAAPARSSFVPPSWYPMLRYALQSEKGACLFGPRGCGKSTAIRELAGELTRPIITLQCAANMQIDSLLGSWTSEAGTLRFVDGPLAEAVRRGAWLIAEEANVIHPGVWSLVNTLTDHTGEGLRLPTSETIAQSPDFRLVLIYNEGYAGTREVNAALKDRLMPIYCGYLSAADECQLLVDKTGAPLEHCQRVQNVAGLIRAANLRFDLSPRSLTRWIRLTREAGLTWRQAYDVAILDLVGPPDLAAPQRACLDEIARNSVDHWKN
jgi:midasin (ATPase involved in ribosome maturation)